MPVKDEFTDDCIALAEKFPGRADVDDRDLTVGQKIRDAEREWVPMIIVYGDNEKSSGKFQVRIRGQEEKVMTFEEIAESVNEMQKGMPFEPLPLPLKMSKRIIFRG